ncbi:hypothetical protein BT69DRAFT_1328003 [Atractiella rhizophila]|nr:hypothetical protein BT69DRAFT_1328003 [Atractiella rhizophila]
MYLSNGTHLGLIDSSASAADTFLSNVTAINTLMLSLLCLRLPTLADVQGNAYAYPGRSMGLYGASITHLVIGTNGSGGQQEVEEVGLVGLVLRVGGDVDPHPLLDFRRKDDALRALIGNIGIGQLSFNLWYMTWHRVLRKAALVASDLSVQFPGRQAYFTRYRT